MVRCVLCALSGFAAPGGHCCLAPVRVPWLWPAACLSGVPRGPAWCDAPRPVWSLSVLQSAFPTPWCLSPHRGLAPSALLGGCTGHAEAGREPGSLCLPLAPAEAGALGLLRVVPVRGPAMGLSLAGPSGVGLGLPALRWLACVDPVTDTSGFRYHPSFDGGLGRCTRAVSCGRRHLPLRVGGRHARVPCVCACACFFWLGRAGRPPRRVLVRLTFSFGRFVFLLCLAPCGLGLPPSWCFAFFLFFFSVSPLFFFPCALFVSCLFWFPAPGALALGALCCLLCWPRASWLSLRSHFLCVAWPLAALRWFSPLPPLSRCSCSSLLSCACFFFSFFSSSLRPPCLWLSVFSSPGCPGPWRWFVFFVLSSPCRVFGFFCPPPLSSLCALAYFVCPGWPVVFPRWLPPPPPSPSVSRGFRRLARCLGFFSLSFRAPPFSLTFSGFRPRVPGALALCFVCFSRPPAAWLSVRSRLVCVSRLAVGCSLVVATLPPPPLLCLAVSVAPAGCLGGFFFLLCGPPLSPAFSGFRPRVPWASALCVVCFVGLPLLGSPWVSPLSCFPPGRWLLPAGCCPPPPLCVSLFSSLPLGAVCGVLCCAVCPWVRCCAALLRVVLCCSVLCCFFALL